MGTGKGDDQRGNMDGTLTLRRSMRVLLPLKCLFSLNYTNKREAPEVSQHKIKEANGKDGNKRTSSQLLLTCGPHG